MLEMKGIVKMFPGIIAVNHVDLEVRAGEILALCGENGAGKSTLMKVLSGVNTPEEGTVIIDGQQVQHFEPKAAINYGVGMIYQELSYVASVSIAENIFIGRLPVKKLGPAEVVDFKKLRADTQALLDRVGIRRDPFTEVSKLAVAERQLVEIARAISRNAKVLVFDEPTSALSDEECDALIGLIRGLAKEGKAIIYITHKLDEVFKLTDMVMVMRDGCKVGKIATKDTDRNGVIKMMVGRELTNIYPPINTKYGDTVLEVRNMNGPTVHDVNFSIRRGEVVGVFGLMGCGVEDVMETLFGARPKTGGEILIDGKQVTIHSPSDAIAAGIYYLPPERKIDGIIPNMSVAENITITNMKTIQRKNGMLDLKKEEKIAQEWVDKLTIRTTDLKKSIAALSGGNQQKALIAKSLITEPRVLIINEPTRGVDVGAKLEIYTMLHSLCEQGMSVIAVCSEMPELMGISNRALCIYEGRITGELQREEFSQEALMHLAIGG